MSSNFQENFHKVNNIMKDQAAIRKIKHTRNQVNKISYLPWYIETRKQRNKNVWNQKDKYQPDKPAIKRANNISWKRKKEKV